MRKVVRLLKGLAQNVLEAEDKDGLRGIEGEGAKRYFSVFDNLILQQKDGFYFVGRSRRPPLDALNALLSFAYALLSHEAASALETVGLDPYVGVFHEDRPGRIGLALDLMEELRAYMADRFVLSFINRKQITANDFTQRKGGGILLKEEARKNFIAAWQKRKTDVITHPFLAEKVEVGLIPYVQALLLARYIRGDVEAYPPFFME